MITVKTLRAILAHLPDEAQINAYEGEGIGLSIDCPGRDGSLFIYTGGDDGPVQPLNTWEGLTEWCRTAEMMRLVNESQK